MTARHRFVVALGTYANADVEQAHLLGTDVEVRAASLGTPDEIAAATADAHGIVVTTNPLPAENIAALGPNVQIIGRAGIGLDAIDLDAARARGVAVVHYPDYATEEVATHALALILAVQRRLPSGDGIARRDWLAWRDLAPVPPLSEATAGVVGLGRIGRAVAERLVPLFGSVIAHDPFVDSPPAGVAMVGELEELLRTSHVVTLHVPMSGAHIIGADELRAMRPDALLVNVSRGGLIDQAALADALAAGEIAGAGLDVLATEPPDPADPILSAPNVLLSPHFAWYSDASERRVRTGTVDAMLDYLHSRPLRVGRLVCDPRTEQPLPS